MNLKPHPSKIMALITGLFLLAGTGLCLEGTEYQIKGAMMVNFIKFVEWPDSFTDIDNPKITIGIFGKNNFGNTLDAVEGRFVGGKQLSVRYVTSVKQLGDCQVLFISASESQRCNQILREIAGLPILTIGEGADFVRLGGIIRFYDENDHIRFEINQTAALHSNLKLSAKLLEIAASIY